MKVFSAFRADQFFNILAIGFLTQVTVLYLPLLQLELIDGTWVLEISSTLIFWVFSILVGIISAWLISSLVGICMSENERPNTHSFLGSITIVPKYLSYFYRRLFFLAKDNGNQRAESIKSVMCDEKSEFSVWIKAQASKNLGIDFDFEKMSEKDMDRLHWLLYIKGQEISANSGIRDGIEGSDLTANFSARLAVILHISFVVQVIIMFSERDVLTFYLAPLFLIFSIAFCRSISASLYKKYELSILRVIALKL